ncbi:hypothetical protein PJ267_07775 [Arthrobacter sp. OVS8]|nr:hypothetical protein PJ267_07775 [Arthrobacter sp. OVS8]
MHISDHRAAGTTVATTLPVPVSSLRWALVRRLIFAIPFGLLFGVMLINGLKLNDSGHATTALAGGMGLSFAVFLGIIWLVGRRRRTLFAASGGDPEAVGVLLFGAMAPKIGGLGPYSESGFHRWAAGFGAGGDGGRGDWG